MIYKICVKDGFLHNKYPGEYPTLSIIKLDHRFLERNHFSKIQAAWPENVLFIFDLHWHSIEKKQDFFDYTGWNAKKEDLLSLCRSILDKSPHRLFLFNFVFTSPDWFKKQHSDAQTGIEKQKYRYLFSFREKEMDKYKEYFESNRYYQNLPQILHSAFQKRAAKWLQKTYSLFQPVLKENWFASGTENLWLSQPALCSKQSSPYCHSSTMLRYAFIEYLKDKFDNSTKKFKEESNEQISSFFDIIPPSPYHPNPEYKSIFAHFLQSQNENEIQQLFSLFQAQSFTHPYFLISPLPVSAKNIPAKEGFFQIYQPGDERLNKKINKGTIERLKKLIIGKKQDRQKIAHKPLFAHLDGFAYYNLPAQEQFTLASSGLFADFAQPFLIKHTKKLSQSYEKFLSPAINHFAAQWFEKKTSYPLLKFMESMRMNSNRKTLDIVPSLPILIPKEKITTKHFLCNSNKNNDITDDLTEEILAHHLSNHAIRWHIHLISPMRQINPEGSLSIADAEIMKNLHHYKWPSKLKTLLLFGQEKKLQKNNFSSNSSLPIERIEFIKDKDLSQPHWQHSQLDKFRVFYSQWHSEGQIVSGQTKSKEDNSKTETHYYFWLRSLCLTEQTGEIYLNLSMTGKKISVEQLYSEPGNGQNMSPTPWRLDLLDRLILPVKIQPHQFLLYQIRLLDD